jgi:hypothetical protein
LVSPISEQPSWGTESDSYSEYTSPVLVIPPGSFRGRDHLFTIFPQHFLGHVTVGAALFHYNHSGGFTAEKERLQKARAWRKVPSSMHTTLRRRK